MKVRVLGSEPRRREEEMSREMSCTSVTRDIMLCVKDFELYSIGNGKARSREEKGNGLIRSR